MKRMCISALVCTLTSVSLPTMAIAQVGAPQSNPNEDIVVTANKRAESLNRTGVTAAVLSGDTLAEKNIVSLSDISSAVPGLSYSQGQYGPPILTLRGVGFQETSLGVYPATSAYLDEIPLPFPVMATHTSFDLQRVEVLKGPQGVLYGQNSTGGGVNFIANKPADTFKGGGSITYGRFSRVEGNGYVSGPLSDTLSARIAFQAVHADDWQKSQTRNAQNGEEKYWAGRFLLNFKPTETARFAFNFNAWHDKSDPLAFQLVAVTPKNFASAPANSAIQFAQPLTDQNARSADWSPKYDPRGDRKFWQTSLRGEFDLSESTTLTALGAYSKYTQNNAFDGDGSAAATADIESQTGRLESSYGEVRISSTAIPGLRWVVGGNYEHDLTHEVQVLYVGENTSSRAATLFLNRSGSLEDQTINSYAAFGNLEYALATNLTLKLGGRYTNTKIDGYECGFDPGNEPGFVDASGGKNGNISALFNLLGSRSGRSFTPAGVNSGCVTLDRDAPNGVPAPFYSTLKEDNVSWRGSLDYQITPDTLLYASVAQGYKAGSFPLIAASSAQQYAPVTQESVLAYEAGIKTNLTPQIHVNLAAFYYNYRNKQVRGKVLAAIFGPLDALVNVPKSRIWGVEGDVRARLTDNLTLTLAGTYLNASVRKYVGYDNYGVANTNFAGVALPNAPKFSYSVGLDYRQPVGGGAIIAGADVSGRSSADAVLGARTLTVPAAVMASGFGKSLTTHYFVIAPYALVNARIGYESDKGNWRFMVWGKNITNKYYYNNVIASSESAARAAGMPATWGATFGIDF